MVKHTQIIQTEYEILEEVKKRYVKSIEKNMKENLFMDSLEKLQRKYEAKGHGIGRRKVT